MEKKPDLWKDPEFLFILFLASSVVYFLVGALSYPRSAALFPIVIGFAGLPLIIFDLLQKISPRFRKTFSTLKGGAVFDMGPADAKKGKKERTAEEEHKQNIDFLKGLSWFLFFFILYALAGYLIASVILIFGFLRFYGTFSIKTSLIWAVSFGVGIWLVFTMFLGVSAIESFIF